MEVYPKRECGLDGALRASSDDVPAEPIHGNLPSRPGGAPPPGVVHDVVNLGSEPLKLYTIYAPPNHLPGRVQRTKADAQNDTADQAVEGQD